MQIKTELVGCLEIAFFSTHKNDYQKVRKKNEKKKQDILLICKVTNTLCLLI